MCISNSFINNGEEKMYAMHGIFIIFTRVCILPNFYDISI